MERSRFGAWLERHVFHIDATLAFLLGLVTIPLSTAITLNLGTTGVKVPSGIIAILGAVQVGALAWRRTRTVPSAVVSLGVALLHFLAFSPPIFFTDICVYIVLYSVTAYGPRWAGITGILSTIFGMLLLSFWMGFHYLGNGDPLGQLIGIALIFIGGVGTLLSTWAVALIQRAKVLRHRELVERANRLEFERDQQSLIATQNERTRIAREMHDVVAHSLSIIIAQADGAQYAAKTDPEVATKTLATISSTGRAALADTRRILGVLRSEDNPEDHSPTTPQPSDHDIGQLVEQVRAAGMSIAFTTIGQPRPLPTGMGLAIYRICQESLTNIMKHAGPNPKVQVQISWRTHDIGLMIADDGRGAGSFVDSDGAGQGLIGMRERAAIFGGEVLVGPRPGGGYQVNVTIPLGLAASPPNQVRYDQTEFPAR